MNKLLIMGALACGVYLQCSAQEAKTIIRYPYNRKDSVLTIMVDNIKADCTTTIPQGPRVVNAHNVAFNPHDEHSLPRHCMIQLPEALKLDVSNERIKNNTVISYDPRTQKLIIAISGVTLVCKVGQEHPAHGIYIGDIPNVYVVGPLHPAGQPHTQPNLPLDNCKVFVTPTSPAQ